MFCVHRLYFGGTGGVGSRFHVLRARTHFRRYQGRRVSFSCFARPDSFSAVRRASGPVFMFCALRLVFGCTEGVGYCSLVLCAHTRFRRYRACRVPFSCFVRPHSFSAVPRASGPVLMFCVSALVFGGTEGVWSRFHVLRSRTRFLRCRQRRVRFSCFARLFSFSAVPRVWGRVFMFCVPHFRRFGGRRVLFSCFARPDSFSAVSRASGPIFMFCAPVLIFDGTEGVGSRFDVLRARTHFRWYRWPRVPFSCVAPPDSFSAVPRASGPLFISCAPGLVFGNIEGVGFFFHVLRYRTRFLPRAFDPVFMFCAPELIFSGTKGVGSRFNVLHARLVFGGSRFNVRSHYHVLRAQLIFGVTEGFGSRFRVFSARTRFRGYRGRRVPSSYFARFDSFSAMSSASGPYFMFCAPVLVFNGTEGVGSRFHVLLSGLVFSGTEDVRSRFHVLRPELIFGGTEGVRSLFHVIRARTHFWRYRGRRVSLLCFALPDSFSAVPRASGLVFIFCTPELVFGNTEGIGSRFHVLCARTHFRGYRGRRLLFSCFALPDSFSAVPRASGLVFMFCAPGLIFDGTEGVGSRFYVLHARTRFRRYRGRGVLFSCFARPKLFLAVSRASGPVFMFCAPGLIFGGFEGVRFCIHVLPSRTCFDGTDGVGSLFHVLHA
jgi:hypothetical protein